MTFDIAHASVARSSGSEVRPQHPGPARDLVQRHIDAVLGE
jgi:hypothetical protein